jgi:type VI secretion system secreted protein Hcp
VALLPAAETPMTAAFGGAGDMFLSIVGTKSGPIKGESQDDKHKGEIDVLGWSWGMKALMEVGTGQSTGRTALKQLRVIKRLDAASCALMSAAAFNEVIKKAVLTVRKAGSVQQEYFKITLEKALISSLDIQAPESSDNPLPLESVTFAFQKIEVEYKQQGADGQLRGSMLFAHDLSEKA